MNKYFSIQSVFVLLLALVACIAPLLSGCAVRAGGVSAYGSPPQAEWQAATIDRVIVQFQPGMDPTDAQFLGLLSEGLGASLIYLRPLSGGAHLLQVRGHADAARFLELVAHLNRRPEVVYAETDARMRHQ